MSRHSFHSEIRSSLPSPTANKVSTTYTSKPRPMAFRQTDGGAFNENVFVDDRFPTIWKGPRFSPSPRDTTAALAEPQHYDSSARTTQSARNPALHTNKSKPIDGNLLRKLFKATVEERTRASRNCVAKPKQTYNVRGKKEAEAVAPQAFHLPPGIGKISPRVRDRPEQKPKEIPDTPSQASKLITRGQDTATVASTWPARPESVKTNLIRISGKEGEEAFVELPISAPSLAYAESTLSQLPLDSPDELVPAAGVEEWVLQITADETQDKSSIKATEEINKKGKKNTKKQQRAEQEEAFQAVLCSEENVANDALGKPLSNDGNTLMSGASPPASATDSGGTGALTTASSVNSEGTVETSRSTYVTHTIMQRTVELRHFSQASKAYNAASTRAPSIEPASTKLSSVCSFEAIGEALTKPVASPVGSTRPFLPASALNTQSDFPRKPDQQLSEVLVSTPEAKRSVPTAVSSTHSIRSHRNFSSLVDRTIASEIIAAQVGERRETTAFHTSTHTGANSSVVGKGSGQSYSLDRRSVRHSSAGKSSKCSKRHGRRLDDGEQDGRSGHSIHLVRCPEQLLDSDCMLARQHESQQPRTEMHNENSQNSRFEAEAQKDFHPQSMDENRNLCSKHSAWSSHSSRGSHRQARHASTRSFSPRDALCAELPSSRSSLRSGSLRSSHHHSGAVPELKSKEHSVLASAIDSVVSLVSRVRSNLTFEELGEGWHDGGVSRDERRRNGSEYLTSNRLPTQTETDDWAQAERLGRQHLWSNASSRRRSRNSSHRSVFRSHASVRPHTRASRSIDDGEDNRWNEPSRSEQLRSAISQHHVSGSTHRSRRSETTNRSHLATASKERSGWSHSEQRGHTLVGAPVHAVVSSAEPMSGHVSSQNSGGVPSQIDNSPRKQRATVFAGRGWITPHPLESSIAERAPNIMLPSDAVPNGATLSYEEWKAIQEAGTRNHRNFSITESNQSERDRHKNDRFRFSGWESRSWHEVEPARLGPNVASAHQASNHESAPASELSGRRSSSRLSRSHPSKSSYNGRVPAMSSSEHLWERMEEGNARSDSHKDDSVQRW